MLSPLSALFDHVLAQREAERALERAEHSHHAMASRPFTLTDFVDEDRRGAAYVCDARGDVRSCPSRDVLSCTVASFDDDERDDERARARVNRVSLDVPKNFTCLGFRASPSGRFACAYGVGGQGPGERERASLFAFTLAPCDGKTKVTSVCDDEFARVSTTRVVRCAWHPNAEATLCALTSDGTFRMINCDDVESGEVAIERSWRLDLRGEFPESSPMKPEVVDFAFAPSSGWGAFTVYFLTSRGDARAMCPIVCRGGKYPKVTVRSLEFDDALAKEWVEETFPDLNDGRTPLATARVAADEDERAIALQGPLSRRPETRATVDGGEDDALAIAISSFSGGSGGGNVVATLHAGAVHVHVVPSEIKPAWCDGPFKNMRGYTFAMSDASSAREDLPPLITVDTIQLTATSDEHHVAKVKFAKLCWDPALRERLFACINGAVHSIVLTWLPILEIAADDMVDVSKSESTDSLPLPRVETLCDFNAPLLGLQPLGDPLAEGVIIALRNDGSYRMLTPPPVSAAAETSSEITTPSKSAVVMQPRTLEASSRSELRALSEGIRRDKIKSADQIMNDAGIHSGMKVGDPGSNEALAKCASALKEIYVDYARDVHDEVRTTALRLQAEIKRQIMEVTALVKSANEAIERHNVLVERVEAAATSHDAIRAKLRDLAEREKKIPHPLTKAEKSLRLQLEACNADIPLIQQRIDELRERAAVATEREDVDIGYVGSRRVVVERDDVSAEDRAVRQALAEQGEAIKVNLAKAKLIEEIIDQSQK